jgi:hypothetical protein
MHVSSSYRHPGTRGSASLAGLMLLALFFSASTAFAEDFSATPQSGGK